VALLPRRLALLLGQDPSLPLVRPGQTLPNLSPDQKATLQANIELCRDAIIFFTATGAARGVGGHSGGPYDTVPEVMILDALFRGALDRFLPVFFDEAGHRVATQYLFSVLRGQLTAEALMQYRAAHSSCWLCGELWRKPFSRP
jgi:hypothetical protein